MFTQANAVVMAGEMKKAGLAASSLSDSAFGHLLEKSDIEMIDAAMKVLEQPAAQTTIPAAVTQAPLSSFGRRAESVEVLARSAAGLSEGGSVASAEAVLGVGVTTFDDLAKACRMANPQSDRREVLAQVVGMAMSAVAMEVDLAAALDGLTKSTLAVAAMPKDGEVTLTALREAAEAGTVAEVLEPAVAPAADQEVSEPVTASVTDPATLAQLAEKFGKPGNSKKAGGVRRHRQQ